MYEIVIIHHTKQFIQRVVHRNSIIGWMWLIRQIWSNDRKNDSHAFDDLPYVAEKKKFHRVTTDDAKYENVITEWIKAFIYLKRRLLDGSWNEQRS